jgi:hypothetical protein
MNNEPKVLVPYDRSEVVTLRKAAAIAGRSESTLRSWCQLHHIGRRVCSGPWEVSRPALLMLLDGDRQTLRAYLDGDRSNENILAYFKRANLMGAK